MWAVLECVCACVHVCVCVGGGLREIHVDKSRTVQTADGRWQENEGKFVHLGQRQGSLFK